MENIMPFALLGLCVGLAAGTEGAVVKDFDISKFLGFWYEIAFASKMGTPGLAHKEEKMGAMVVELKENLLALTTTYYSSISLDSHWRAPTKQVRGNFPLFPGKKEVVVEATDYLTYAIIDITSLVAGAVHRTMKLYSRSLDDNGEALYNFRKITSDHGFSETDLYILKHDLTCVKVLQSAAESRP
nr:epididymal-specific lipocalin-5 isoform X1 [Rattus norvegicus]